MLITAPFKNKSEWAPFCEPRPGQREGHPFFLQFNKEHKRQEMRTENLNGKLSKHSKGSHVEFTQRVFTWRVQCHPAFQGE